jgi:hypothetical protein
VTSQPTAQVAQYSLESRQEWGFEQDNEVWGFLYTLAGSGAGQEFTPKSSPELGIGYNVNGIEVPADRLRQIAERGMLDIAGVVSFVSCPDCSGMHLFTMLKCPTCRKQTLSKSELVIHYECGNLAPILEIMPPG